MLKKHYEENNVKELVIKLWSFFLFFLICFLCFLIVGSDLSSAATVYIDTDGTGNYNCDGTNDHIEINNALNYIDGLGGGTVYLRGPNTYWIDETLEIGSNTILTGDTSACIKLVPNAGWEVQVPLIRNKKFVNKNITIKGFEIDGNSGNQPVSLGAEYYNMMYFVNCTDVTVTGMRLEWGTCDGLKIRNSPYNYTFLADIKFTDNSVYKLGHDALYVLGINGVTVANNDVYTRTNSAFRLSSSGHAKIYNNVIHSEFSSTSNGPGIEIDKSSGILSAHKSESIEIYNNLFHTLYGSAIWITGEDADNVVRGKDVYIHHNIMYNVGQYPIDTGYSNAAITIGQFNNTRIENNVIDNGGHAGIKYYRYIKFCKMSSKFTTIVKNNVIINCAKNVATGVWNYNSENHRFILYNNCIYRNTNSAYVGENIIHSGDIYVDPLFVSSATRDYHLKSTEGHYSNGKWMVDTVSSSLIDAGCPTSVYSNEPFPNGGRINIGRYGNTAEASKSVSSTPPPPMVSYLPEYDNRLRESLAGNVLSDSAYLDIGRSTSRCRDVMWFDLSAYSPATTISQAALSLYWYYPAGATRASDTVVEVYRPVQWDPQYVTWNTRMSGTPWTTPGGNWFDKDGVAQGATPYASVTFPASKIPDNRYYKFDVTELVQEYVSGEYQNTGFFLKARTESGNYIAFYSSEWSNAVQRPKLTVTTASGFVDNPPVANAGADKTATTGSLVTFDGSASTDDKGIASYSWDFDASDGITSEATSVTSTKTYTTEGNYTVTLTVTDTGGQSSSDTLQVVVSSTTNTITYTPDYDNRLRQSSPNSVLSTYNYIDIGALGTTSYRDVIWFDLSGYNPTDTISQAALSLYWYYPAGATRASDTIVEIYRPVQWDPQYVTWNTRMSGTPWTTPGGNWFDKNGVAQGATPYASVTFPASTVPGNKYYEFDVTQLVQEYISGTYENTGFFLKAKTESANYIAFYSSEWSNADQGPKLTLTRI